MKSLYTNAKVLWYPDRLATLRSGEPVAPVHVRIKPTNVCNHCCYFCAYRSDRLSLGRDMKLKGRLPREKMMEIVDDLIEMGVEAVTFSGGGEPLIYPHIVEAVTRLAKGDVKVAALTNGSRLSGKVADAFARWGSWVRVSIDGWDGESYVRYRRVKSTEFDRVMRNPEAFSRRQTACVLGASLIVDRGNADKVHRLCRSLKEHGVRHVKISPCIVSNEGAETDAYHAEKSAVVRAEIARVRELDGPDFQIVDHYHGQEGGFDKPYERCPFLRFLTVIGADGTVYTCQNKAYTEAGALGSLEKRGFKEFWFSEETQEKLRQINPRLECTHHCVAEAKNRLLFDYLRVDPRHAEFV